MNDIKYTSECETLMSFILVSIHISEGIVDVFNCCDLITRFYIDKQGLFTDNMIDFIFIFGI